MPVNYFECAKKRRDDGTENPFDTFLILESAGLEFELKPNITRRLPALKIAFTLKDGEFLSLQSLRGFGEGYSSEEFKVENAKAFFGELKVFLKVIKRVIDKEIIQSEEV